MASDTYMRSCDDRMNIELDAKVKFYKVVGCIEKWQIASCQIPDDLYEADSEDYLGEAESLHVILTNAYLYLESSAMCELSSSIKNKKAKLMEELTYEINYLQSISLKKSDDESTDVPSDVTELLSIETVSPVCTTELPAAYPDSTEQVSRALHAVDAFNSADSHKTQFVSTDSTTVTSYSAVHQKCHSTFKPQIIEDVPSTLPHHTEEQPTDETVSTNHVVPSSVSTSVETDCHNDTTTAVKTVTSVHMTPAITVDEEAKDCAITRYDEATTEIMEQICTATEASTDCTEQLNITLPAANAPICDRDHTTELLSQDTDTYPAAIYTQSTMLQNPESNSTSQIRMDSNTEEQTYDRKFWCHQYEKDDIHMSLESMSIVQICCHSENSCEILYLLLYS